MMFFNVVPAYGRDYKTKAEIIADWQAGKDFMQSSIFSGGSYVNNSVNGPNVTICVRYANLRKVTSFLSTAKK